jgi:hypothetical protein
MNNNTKMFNTVLYCNILEHLKFKKYFNAERVLYSKLANTELHKHCCKGLGLQTSEYLTGVRFNHVFKTACSWDHCRSWDKGPGTQGISTSVSYKEEQAPEEDEELDIEGHDAEAAREHDADVMPERMHEGEEDCALKLSTSRVSDNA